MKVILITIDTADKMSNGELVNHHLKMHQQWAQKKYKKIDITSIKRAHDAIKQIMLKRGLKHNPCAMKQVLSKLALYNEDID